jgi:replication factor C subunit 1
MKASSVFAPRKAVKEAPDLEEAMEESDDGEVPDQTKEEADDMDISKDKYIKAPKKKSAAAAKPKAKSKKRAIDSDAEESEAKKPKPKAAAKGKGRGKK